MTVNCNVIVMYNVPLHKDCIFGSLYVIVVLLFVKKSCRAIVLWLRRGKEMSEEDDGFSLSVYKRERRSTVVGNPALSRQSFRRDEVEKEPKKSVSSSVGSSASCHLNSSPRRSHSFLAHACGPDIEGRLTPITTSFGSLGAQMPALSNTPMRERARSSSSRYDSHSAENSPSTQRRYHDISKGTSMANFKIASRSHRQLRPLRKGVTGLSEADIHALGRRLRLSFYEEKIIKNRRIRLVMYPVSFLASDAIDWLVAKGEADTQQQAVTIMLCMQRNHVVYSLVEQQEFNPSSMLLRFSLDDTGKIHPPLFDLIDIHTANQFRTWAAREKGVITEHTQSHKAYRLAFRPNQLVECLMRCKECDMTELGLVKLCQVLQEGGALVQIFPKKPAVFKGVSSMLFRFRQDQASIDALNEDGRRKASKSPSRLGSHLPRWMSTTEGLSAAVKTPISKARNKLMKRRDTIHDNDVQVHRPDSWNSVNVTLVSSLNDQWGFTLHGTGPVQVAAVDEEGPARKLLVPGDILLRIDNLDVFHMTGQQVMSVIRSGKPFCQAAIFQKEGVERGRLPASPASSIGVLGTVL